MACPAIESLIFVLKNYGPPILSGTYIEENRMEKDPTTGQLKKLPPGPLPRLQAAAGPHKAEGDPHDNGLALDIILRASDPRFPDEKAMGEKLYKVFFDNMKVMQFVSAKYNHKECNGTNGWSTDAQYDDKKHETHIHIHWKFDDSRKTDWEEAIAGAVSAAFP